MSIWSGLKWRLRDNHITLVTEQGDVWAVVQKKVDFVEN